MTIQAAAAGDAFDKRPAEVREALRAIESTGRDALAELRRLLAGENGSFAPAPGLAGLEALAQRVRSAGLAVELSAEPMSLPPSVDLSAYRIVQEALTNTLKHARATTARVDVRRLNGALEIDVVDDGQGAETVTPGHGIIGMRERAALFGGDLTAGPAPGGGFAVRARIPVT
jgi:signal transduction histidine kinase